MNTLHESALVPAESDPSAGCQTLVATGGYTIVCLSGPPSLESLGATFFVSPISVGFSFSPKQSKISLIFRQGKMIYNPSFEKVLIAADYQVEFRTWSRDAPALSRIMESVLCSHRRIVIVT